MDKRKQTWWCNIHSSFTICLLTQALFSGATVLRLCVNPSFTSISGSNKERNCWRVSWTCKRCNCWAETQNHTVTTKNPSLTKIHPTCGSAMETISLASWESGVSQLPLPLDHATLMWFGSEVVCICEDLLVLSIWSHQTWENPSKVMSKTQNVSPQKNSNKGDFGALFREYWGLAHLIRGTAWMR